MSALESATPLLAGAFAGLAVDLSLFPLDTIKTRLQAKRGFMANGGYKGLYKGMGSIAAGSAPGAALFFYSYETCKSHIAIQNDTALAIVSGCIAETLACLIRTPTEIIKQRTQTSATLSSWQTLQHVLKADGLQGLYRGFAGTLAREIPFVSIQFPLWEKLKEMAVAERGASLPHSPDPHYSNEATPAEAAVCGAVAGGFAAACTTPMDVIKTRLMLASTNSGWFNTIGATIRDEGVAALMKGIVPRICWISLGGFIFLGGYSSATKALNVTRRELDL